MESNLPDKYQQGHTNIDDIVEITQDNVLTIDEKLKRLFIFIGQSINFESPSYLLLGEPFRVNRTVEVNKVWLTLIDSRPPFKVKYDLDVYGWLFVDHFNNTWSTTNIKKNKQRLLELIENHQVIVRTDKNEGIRESNSLNHLISEYRKKDNSNIHLEFEMWSAYELIQKIKHKNTP